jgi:cell division protein FtsZ
MADDFSDNVPAPAYRPEVAPAGLQSESIEAFEEEASQFMAPRPPAAGTPSPQAMDRLQAAIHKTPGRAAAPVQPFAEPNPAAEKPRFGINSLINRMTGHGEDAAAPRAQPAHEVAPENAPQADADQDRIEIPAFLRRQAN